MIPGLILLGILVGVAVLYVVGWRRLRRRGFVLATVFRLLVFLVGVILVGIVFLSPLNLLNQDFFFARQLQTVLLCLLAVPAFFVGSAYAFMRYGLPRGGRRTLAGLAHRNSRLGHAVRRVTPPWTTWMIFVTAFVIWQEPGFASWTLAHPIVHTTLLLLLGFCAMLFWWHIVGTGPRLHPEFAPWLIVIMLVLTEIVNMSIAMPTAFATTAFYSHYAEPAAALGSPYYQRVLEDQVLAGGILWVVGSLVYISSIVLVINRLFQRHGAGQPEHLAEWDADDRMIMPGLEHRLRK